MSGGAQHHEPHRRRTLRGAVRPSPASPEAVLAEAAAIPMSLATVKRRAKERECLPAPRPAAHPRSPSQRCYRCFHCPRCEQLWQHDTAARRFHLTSQRREQQPLSPSWWESSADCRQQLSETAAAVAPTQAQPTGAAGRTEALGPQNGSERPRFPYPRPMMKTCACVLMCVFMRACV